MEIIAIIICLFLVVWWFTKTRRSKDNQVNFNDIQEHQIIKIPPPEAPEPSHYDGEIAFVDLETTGLDPLSDRIIEVAVIFYKPSSSKFDGYSALANPGFELPERITELTGITDEMLKDEKTTAEIVEILLDRVGGRPIAAYNAEFDMSFLKSEAKRIGRRFDNVSHCIMEYTKANHPNLRRYRLQDACEAFHIVADGAIAQGLSPHRALYDAERALRLFVAINNGRAPEKEDENYQHGRQLDHLQLSKYHGIRSSAKIIQEEAKDAEKDDLDKAIYGYGIAIKLHMQAAKIQIYTAIREDNDQSLYPESGDVECLNRLTMGLCKQGKGMDANVVMNEYFSTYPKDSTLRVSDRIRKRVAKAVVLATFPQR
jgi:DNA polymerase III epsilon subunit-like protein